MMFKECFTYSFSLHTKYSLNRIKKLYPGLKKHELMESQVCGAARENKMCIY